MSTSTSIRLQIRTSLLLLWSLCLDLRQSWFWQTIMITLSPVVILTFLRFVVPTSDKELVEFIVTGNVVAGMTLSSLLTLGQELGFLKDSRAFDHYATLPISKVQLVVALVTKGTLFSLPSMALLLGAGALLFDIRLTVQWTIIPVIILSGYALSGLGAAIGFYSRKGSQAALITQIISPLIIYLAPVMVPATLLPVPLRLVGTLLPTTYAARGLRASLLGTTGIGVWTDLGILAAFSLFSLIVVLRRIDWRT